MKIGVLAIALVLSEVSFSIPAFAAEPAQASDDALTLADGSTLHGRVTEQVPGSHVVIVTADGRAHTVPWAQVGRVDAAAAPSSPRVDSRPPALVVAPATHERPHAETSASVSPPAAATPGFFLSVRTGVLVPAGRYGDAGGLGLGDFGPGAAATLSIGYFPTSHIGLLVGARGSYGHNGVSGCNGSSSSSDCGGYTLQVPLMLEYAFSGRTRGFFLDAGVGLFTSFNAYANAFTVTATSPVEAKLGLGYRWEFITGTPDARKPRHMGFEVYANADMGQFTHIDVASGEGEVNGDIRSDKRALHVTADVGLAFFWGP